jgi:hypothetical protein
MQTDLVKGKKRRTPKHGESLQFHNGYKKRKRKKKESSEKVLHK